jgi:hypothetical protein
MAPAANGSGGDDGAREWAGSTGRSASSAAAAAVLGVGGGGGGSFGQILPWFWGGEGRRVLLSRIIRALLESGQAFEV